MEVNEELVSHLANLSRLHFSEDEKKEIREDLQRMISFVEKLNRLDTEGLDPVLHMSSEINCLRKDEVKGSVTVEEALGNAKDSYGHFFTVPKVIRK
jgi:aspartyl-tRNA(Asn)/glutamyl-tRNA(Gln) amidotransferase subunit C